MDRPSQQFLSRSRLASDEHGRHGGTDGLGLTQNPAEGRTLADHGSEIVRELDLFDQIRILPCQLPAQLVDFFVGLHVVNRVSDLCRDLTKKFQVLRIRLAALYTPDVQGTQASLADQ